MKTVIMLSPINKSEDTVMLRTLSPAKISELWQNRFSICLGKIFCELPVIEHWRCNTTNFEWYEPKECAGDAELYAQLQRYDWYYMQDKWEFRTALDLFEKGSNILEIGVGFGHFLDAARERGISVSGVEMNPSAANSVRQKGFIVYDDLSSLSESLGPVFDGICAFQVLEHISNPMPFLSEMLSLVRNGGKLVLSVPNAAVARVIDPERSNLLDQPPHHVSHWDEKVFISLEKLLPVRISMVKREPLQSYHVQWFVSSVMRQWQRNFYKGFDRALVNRYSIKLANRLMQLGLRKLFPGHTLFVVFEKVS